MPKVSIFVLVNGIEKYIERCADSLYNQTIDDVESVLFKDSALQTCVYFVINKISKKQCRKFQLLSPFTE